MDKGQGTLPKDVKRPEGTPPLAKPCRDGDQYIYFYLLKSTAIHPLRDVFMLALLNGQLILLRDLFRSISTSSAFRNTVQVDIWLVPVRSLPRENRIQGCNSWILSGTYHPGSNLQFSKGFA